MATSIRAAVCRAFGEPLVIENLWLAAPEEGQIEVRIVASAICHSDISYIDGAWGASLPAVWGHEAAGVVEAIGSGVAGLAIGDHVVVTLIRSCGSCRNCLLGASVACVGDLPTRPNPLSDSAGNPVGHGYGTAAFAERVVVEASQVVAIDAGIDLAPAALLACGVITGVGAATNTARVQPGSTAVVIGAGGVGLNAVQGSRMCGASTIIAVDISDAKLEASRRFGSTDVVNSATEDLHERVRSITGGQMADYVLVTVGAQQPIETAPSLLAPNGAAVIVGMPATGVTATIDPVTIASSNQRILGSKMGNSTIATHIPDLVAKYRSGELLLDQLITNTYRLDEINEAIEAVRSADAVRNVIVFGEAG